MSDLANSVPSCVVEMALSPTERIYSPCFTFLFAFLVVTASADANYLASLFFLIVSLGFWQVVRHGRNNRALRGDYWLKADSNGVQGEVIDQAANGSRLKKKVIVPWNLVTDCMYSRDAVLLRFMIDAVSSADTENQIIEARIALMTKSEVRRTFAKMAWLFDEHRNTQPASILIPSATN